jgi:hypothetical protein
MHKKVDIHSCCTLVQQYLLRLYTNMYDLYVRCAKTPDSKPDPYFFTRGQSRPLQGSSDVRVQYLGDFYALSAASHQSNQIILPTQCMP